MLPQTHTEGALFFYSLNVRALCVKNVQCETKEVKAMLVVKDMFMIYYITYGNHICCSNKT